MTDSLSLLRVVLVIEAIVAVALVVSVFTLAGLRALHDRRHLQSLEEARTAIAAELDSEADISTTTAARLFYALPRRSQIRIVWELAPHLRGRSLEALATVATHAGLVHWAEIQCRSRSWWKRLKGVRLLGLLNIDVAGARSLIQDPHPLVRASAIEWAAGFASGPTMQRMVRSFDDDSALCRFTLQDSLLQAGSQAVPALCTYFEDQKDRTNPAAVDVAIGLAEPRFAKSAELLSNTGEASLRSRSAILLAAIGGQKAISRNLELLGDPDSVVRSRAARGIAILGHWPAAPEVGRLLDDANWTVRKEAGLALRELGAPGLLVLRRYAKGEQGDASEMARHILSTAVHHRIGDSP